MIKSGKSWIIAGLMSLASFLATIYSIVAYPESVRIVGAMCLLFLISAFWLFICINQMLENRNSQETKTVGENQRERMNYEGMKLQGEEMIRLMNSLGKGTYISTKRSAEYMDALLRQYAESRQINERLLKMMIEEQHKASKLQIKYNQNDTRKMISALTEQCARLDTDFNRAITAIQSQTPAAPDNSVITESLHTLTVELAHINSSIQALQIQLNSMPQTVTYAAPMQAAQAYTPQAPIPEAPAQPIFEEAAAKPLVEPIMEEAAMDAALEDMLVSEPVAEEAPAPEPIVEEIPTPEPIPEPIAEEIPTPEPIEETIAEPIMEEAAIPDTALEDMLIPEPIAEEIPTPEPIEETIAEPIMEEAAIPDTALEDMLIPEPIVEEAPAPEPIPEPVAQAAPSENSMLDQSMIDAIISGGGSSEPEPAPAPAPSDNPNKQLSPDEIAALFTAMG